MRTVAFHNVRVADLELDEVWTFVGCKQRRLTPERIEKGMMGDAYTFIGLERTSKLVVAWHLGKRDRVTTEDFVSKIRWATAPGWFDVSTDGFEPYETAIDAGLYDRANHSQVVKLFSTRLDRVSESYMPAKFVSVAKDAISGQPDLDRAGTSHVERKNGTLRQWCKRLTRLTKFFLEKVGQSEGRACAPLHLLQLLPDSFLDSGYPGDGIGSDGSRLDYRGADILTMTPLPGGAASGFCSVDGNISTLPWFVGLERERTQEH